MSWIWKYFMFSIDKHFNFPSVGDRPTFGINNTMKMLSIIYFQTFETWHRFFFSLHIWQHDRVAVSIYTRYTAQLTTLSIIQFVSKNVWKLMCHHRMNSRIQWTQPLAYNTQFAIALIFCVFMQTKPYGTRIKLSHIFDSCGKLIGLGFCESGFREWNMFIIEFFT